MRSTKDVMAARMAVVMMAKADHQLFTLSFRRCVLIAVAAFS
jgi:hypothetical protein